MDSNLPRKGVRWRTFAKRGPALSAVLAAAVAALAGCEADQANGGPAPAIVLSNVTLRHYGKDGVQRVGRSEEVVFRRDSGQLEARTLSADVPPTDRMGRGGTHLEAGHGEADIKGQTARLDRGVVLVTGDGDEGRTESATWEQQHDLIVGDSPVQVIGPDYEVNAESFRFRVHDQKLELGGGVRFQSEPSESGVAP